jgi:type I restriction-modification system DNA methylase subunit
VYVVWSVLPAGRILVSDARAISKALTGLIGDHLLVTSTDEGSVWQFIYPATAAAKPILRRIVVERGLPRRTVVTQLAKVYHEAQKVDIRTALESAYDVEPVTKEFFHTYRETFERVLAMIQGVPDDEMRRLFCQTLFNRLMFLYFLQRKGWLKFNDDPNYLPSLLRASKAAGNENFFRHRLKLLFFAALNNSDSRDVVKGGVDIAVGDVPFLNGGLFEEGEIDRDCAGADVPNEAFDAVLAGLFERFNFTVSESTPYDIEVAVDPEMLGKVFEELVTGRHERGSYYTPRPVVAFMCREALKGYLETKVERPSAVAIRRFVDEHNVEGLDLTQAGKVAEALDQVTVCDPACGSGAYLVGMLHELIELKQALYSEKLGRDPTRLYDMKLHVIERNLYGAISTSLRSTSRCSGSGCR